MVCLAQHPLRKWNITCVMRILVLGTVIIGTLAIVESRVGAGGDLRIPSRKGLASKNLGHNSTTEYDATSLFNRFFNQAASRLYMIQPSSLSSSSSSSIEDDNNNLLDPNQKANSPAKSPGQYLSPVLLVPGYGGSRLEARWTKHPRDPKSCSLTNEWSTIWIDIKLMLPWYLDCLIDNMKLEFDPMTNTSHSRQGVEVRAKTDDELVSVETITEGSILPITYFEQISRRLIAKFSYERGKNIRGAPYDFRKAPNELGDFFANMRTTIEDMYRQHNNKRITFICHSMGCNNVLYFLQRRPAEWKKKYIRRLISLAAPWGGSMNALRAVVFGDNLHLPIIFDEKRLRPAQESLPSTIYLFPNEKAFGQRPLIKTHIKKNKERSEIYTANLRDYEKFFQKINLTQGYNIHLLTKDLLNSLEPPGVEVWCLYGHHYGTLAGMEFKEGFPNSQEYKIYEDGDETVTVSSLKYCSVWSKEQEEPVHLRDYRSNHLAILKNPRVIDQIEEIISDHSEIEGKNTLGKGDIDDYDMDFQS